jgi:Cu/Ag efflux protein CusF
MFAGCAAAYQPPPLTTAHPAHPEAMAAPEQPPSNTLSYRPSDIPSPQPASYMAERGMHGSHPSEMAERGMHGSHSSEQESQQTFVGEGKVIAVVPSSGQLVVDHGEIKGLMEAMTMGYRIDPPSLLEGLQAGDTIRFTINKQNKAIVKIEKLNQ